MSIRHLTDTRGRSYSKRFSANENHQQAVDTADLRRQIRLNKDAGNAKFLLHNSIAEKLLEAYDLLNGKPKEDLRRIFGS